MILDRIEHLSKYEAVIPGLKDALAFAETLHGKAPGRYEFPGGFVLVQEGATTQQLHEGLYEAHRNYIDVQWVVSGSEWVCWADLVTLTEEKPYQPDIWFFQGKSQADFEASAGMVYIMFPNDGHIPCSHVGTPTTNRKYVIKLPWKGTEV